MTLLETYTYEFMALHWPCSAGPAPHWSQPWSLRGPGPAPNADAQGCYAIYANDSLVYIGLAAGNGAGGYVGHGIGSRLYKHVLRINWAASKSGDRCYMPLDRWKEATHIRTLGFATEFSYLAPALEMYLISCLQHDPALTNRLGRSRSNRSSKQKPLRGSF